MMGTMFTPTSELPQLTDGVVLRARSGRHSRSLAQQLFDEFSAQIAKGHWAAGDKLPTESRLVAHYDVSRTVVREAISKLQAAQLVETRHGIGTFVLESPGPSPLSLSPMERDAAVDVLAVLELRISIEIEAAGLAALRHKKRDLQAMQQALAAFVASHENGQDTVAHDLSFHLAIATATGNRYFVEVLKHFNSLLIPRTRIESINRPDRAPDYLLRLNHEHEAILSAIERKDVESARAAMRLHLTNSRERLRHARQDTGA